MPHGVFVPNPIIILIPRIPPPIPHLAVRQHPAPQRDPTVVVRDRARVVHIHIPVEVDIPAHVVGRALAPGVDLIHIPRSTCACPRGAPGTHAAARAAGLRLEPLQAARGRTPRRGRGLRRSRQGWPGPCGLRRALPTLGLSRRWQRPRRLARWRGRRRWRSWRPRRMHPIARWRGRPAGSDRAGRRTWGRCARWRAPS